MIVATAVATLVVVAILGVVAYAFFEISPFARHRDRYHEPGQRQASPRLD
jgi:hypothetical protein